MPVQPSVSVPSEIIMPQNVSYKDASISHKLSYPVCAEKVLISYNDEDPHLFKILISQCRYVLFFVVLDLIFNFLDGPSLVTNLVVVTDKKVFAA